MKSHPISYATWGTAAACVRAFVETMRALADLDESTVARRHYLQACWPQPERGGVLVREACPIEDRWHTPLGLLLQSCRPGPT